MSAKHAGLRAQRDALARGIGRIDIRRMLRVNHAVLQRDDRHTGRFEAEFESLLSAVFIREDRDARSQMRDERRDGARCDESLQKRVRTRTALDFRGQRAEIESESRRRAARYPRSIRCAPLLDATILEKQPVFKEMIGRSRGERARAFGSADGGGDTTGSRPARVSDSITALSSVSRVPFQQRSRPRRARMAADRVTGASRARVARARHRTTRSRAR